MRDAQLAWRNRRILADRLGWPAGALAACEALDRRFPGWHTSWAPANTAAGFEAPAGYWATDQPGYGHRAGQAHGADPNALAVAIVRRQAARAAQDEEWARWRGRWRERARGAAIR